MLLLCGWFCVSCKQLSAASTDLCVPRFLLRSWGICTWYFQVWFVSGILQSKILRRSHSPSPTPDSIRRHNSAPNTSESEDDVAAAAAAAAASLLSVSPVVPRTRSSTCLEDLVQENASPKLDVKEHQVH